MEQGGGLVLVLVATRSIWGFRGANRSHPNEDKHQAPSSTPPRPLSLQDAGGHFLSFPDSVVTIHQDGDMYMTDLDCQYS